jgi:L-amino acid N-acyltransferase
MMAVTDPISNAVVPLENVHADQVAAIYNEEVDKGDTAPHTVPLSAAECVEWLREGGERFGAVVYIRDDRVDGWAALIPSDSGSAYSLTAQLVLYVSRHARGEGIGKRLIAEAIAMARGRGFHGIIALVPSEPGWRLTWLRKHGFELCGEIPSAVDQRGDVLDISVLQILLDKGEPND